MRIVVGLIGIIIGIMIVKKTYQLVEFFGKSSWAESKLGGGLGGTYVLYKIIGVVIIVFSAMHMLGILDLFVLPFRRIFGG
jgi:hypothetical protein